MKKSILTLTCVVLAGIITSTTSSCSKSTDIQILQAYWNLALHTLTHVDAYIYLAGNYSSVEMALATPATSVFVNMKGTTTGNYNGVGTSTDAGSLTMSSGGKNYSSNILGGSASINWSVRDDSKMWMEVSYSGTVVNQVDPLDKIDITQGIAKVKFRF